MVLIRVDGLDVYYGVQYSTQSFQAVCRPITTETDFFVSRAAWSEVPSQTKYDSVANHPWTNQLQYCLTSLIAHELVRSTDYKPLMIFLKPHYCKNIVLVTFHHTFHIVTYKIIMLRNGNGKINPNILSRKFLTSSKLPYRYA